LIKGFLISLPEKFVFSLLAKLVMDQKMKKNKNIFKCWEALHLKIWEIGPPPNASVGSRASSPTTLRAKLLN
jgi:hypothetical protein